MTTENDNTTNDTTNDAPAELGGLQIGHAVGELLGRVLADLDTQGRQELRDFGAELLKLEGALPKFCSSTTRAALAGSLLAKILEQYPMILQHSAGRLAEQFDRELAAEGDADAPTVPISVDEKGEG